jgi:putative tricarboxylic transport membrane protein
VVGVYSINTTTDEVILMVLFGVIGYLMKKYNYEAAPLIMAMILSPLMENNLRQSLALSHGSFTIFFTRPISAVLMITAIALLILPNLPRLKRRKKWEGLEETE